MIVEFLENLFSNLIGLQGFELFIVLIGLILIIINIWR